MGEEEPGFTGLNRAGGTKGGATGRGPSPVGISDQHSSAGALDTEANSAFLLGVYTPVSSSNVQGIQYELETETLTITFNNDTTYEYPGVNADMALSMLTSTSKGQWVWRNLRKPGWPFLKVGTFSGTIKFHD